MSRLIQLGLLVLFCFTVTGPARADALDDIKKRGTLIVGASPISRPTSPNGSASNSNWCRSSRPTACSFSSRARST